MNVLVDTNILIYLLEGDEALVELLSDRSVFASFITEIELLGYPHISDNDTAVINALLQKCTLIDITDDIKRRAIEIRRKHRLRVPDALIAATALSLRIPFLTADSDFVRLDELDLLQYAPNE